MKHPHAIANMTERWIYWTSFFIRCFLGLSAWSLSEYASIVLVEDAALYEHVGARIAQEWIAGGTSPTLTALMDEGRQAWVMYLVLAVCSFAVGGARALPIVIVLFNLVTAWVPVYTFRIALILGVRPPAALRAAQLIMFSPVFAFWSGALYKEGLVLLALNLIAYHVLVLQQSFRLRSLAALAASLSVLLGLRFYLAALLPPAVLLSLLLGRGRQWSRWRKALTVGALCVALAALGFGSRLDVILPDDAWHLLEQIQGSRDDLSTSRSGYLAGTVVSEPLQAITFLPKGIVYFLGVPFPWELGSIRQNLVLPEMLFWLLHYPLIFAGMREGFRRNFEGSLLLGLLTLTMLGFYGLFVGNVGTAYRLRAQVWLFWAVFAGWYWDARKHRGRSRVELPSGAGLGSA